MTSGDTDTSWSPTFRDTILKERTKFKYIPPPSYTYTKPSEQVLWGGRRVRGQEEAETQKRESTNKALGRYEGIYGQKKPNTQTQEFSSARVKDVCGL